MEDKKKIWAVTAYRCELGDTLDAGLKAACYRYRKVIFSRDEKPLREIIYATDGSERAIILFEYDKASRLLSKETLYPRDHSSEKTIFQYNEKGHKTEEVQYYDGELYDRCEMHYNELGLQLESIHFDEQNIAFEKDEFEYNEQDMLVRHRHLDEDNQVIWETLMEYNDKGLLATEVNNRIQERTAELTRSVYNDQGLKIRSEAKDLSGQTTGVVEIFYNPEGLPVRYISETFGAAPSKMINQVVYDEQGRAITNEYYDVLQGMLVMREHVSYDEDGNIREEEMYEVNTEKSNSVAHYRLQMAYEYHLPEELGRVTADNA